ncbi:MAG: S9 family peptidase, partial [Pseudomonadales bacterium]|nr:S9 family peptidase [Pseudomonadales bacterium]
YWHRQARAFKRVDLLEIDAHTGAVQPLLTETSETNVDPGLTEYHMMTSGDEWIWASERDGWKHLYLWDRNGIKQQITRGEWVVREIIHVDETERRIYFKAGGREPNRDPYYRHFYSVGFDGGKPRLLTPEDADHQIYFPESGDYFVDNYSRVDSAPVCVVRHKISGKVAMTVAQANIDALLEAGWTKPEPFRVKARDGKTDLFGVIYRPANLDPKQKYPVIDATYSGPHAVRTPKSFYQARRGGDAALAQLGFIVVTVDGMGTAKRSKAFHDFSYGNLGDIGAPDHMTALQQLAERYPYMDLDRVGIYGHSAGGYDSARAVLAHPDFYKVAVSS